jgi:hypothetical protein
MPINRITSTEFASIISTGVSTRDPSLDVNIGVFKDLFIDPPSEVLEQQNNRMVYLNSLMSLKNANSLVPDDVDDLVFNEGMVRSTGSSAVATIKLIRVQPPTVDIVVPANFPFSTLPDPKTGLSIMFRTIEQKTMVAASPAAYYNPDNGRYELEISVASVSTGDKINVGANTITTFRRPLPQFDQVTNTEATTSGKGIETNAQLADRFLLHIEGSQIATPDGVKSYVLDNYATVEDVYVVYGNSEYLEREEDDAGAFDVWIRGEVPTLRTYYTTYMGIDTLIPLDRQPVISISTVSTSAGGGVVYVEGTDYEIITDSGNYSYSDRGVDGIKFIVGGAHPSVGDPLEIVFRYNGLISSLTSYFNQPYRYTIGCDKLFRWAQPIEIQIQANLRVSAGNPSTIINTVKNKILQHVNNLSLGESVEEFDIDSVVATVYGVDNFTYDLLSIKTGSGVADITVPPNQYASLDPSDLIINLI